MSIITDHAVRTQEERRGLLLASTGGRSWRFLGSNTSVKGDDEGKHLYLWLKDYESMFQGGPCLEHGD